MLSDAELAARLSALELPEDGIAYIRRVRTSPPAREVSSTGKGNTTWRYASHKMGCTIQGESSLERNFLVHCEYAKDVAEFWDQPEAVSVTFISKSGRLQRVSYTADVLVITDTAVTAYQIKPWKDCNRLVEQRPSRWGREADGYIDTSAEKTFSAMGIRHCVVTEKEIGDITAENLSALLQARRNSRPTDHEQSRKILAELAKDGILTVAELLRRSRTSDCTALFRLIDSGRVAALLDKHRLADPEDALVGLDKSRLEEIANQREKIAWKASLHGIPHTQAPSLEQIKLIVERQRQLENPGEATVSKRTLRRWRRALSDAKNVVSALATKTHLRGNRSRRVDNDNLTLIADAIKERLLVPNAGTITAAYCTYVGAHALRYAKASEPQTVKPVSLPTFFAEVSRISPATKAAAQGGVRSANAHAAPIDPSLRTLVPLRPFERVHIDHYQIDQHVVVLQSGDGEKGKKRPWLTAMIDQATHVILAISISFRSPSRHACACVIRDCVRRHARLPETIVVDHGSDFESVFFEGLLARYGVTKHERPPHAPRFGGPIESTFHSIREELIRSLDGSTSNDQRDRSVSPSHRGQTLASWRLWKVYVAYEDYFYQHFNLKVRGTSICSAEQNFDQSMEAFPFSGIAVEYDVAFQIATSIPLDRKHAVKHNRGITHNNRWYFHAGLLDVPHGGKVDVLEDPWDDGRLYASVNGKWLTCLFRSGCAMHGSPDLRMLRSIEFLESQSIRREEALARRVALESWVNRLRTTSSQHHQTEEEPAFPLQEKRNDLSSPDVDTPRPSPYLTYEGHLDGHPTNRK